MSYYFLIYLIGVALSFVWGILRLADIQSEIRVRDVLYTIIWSSLSWLFVIILIMTIQYDEFLSFILWKKGKRK